MYVKFWFVSLCIFLTNIFQIYKFLLQFWIDNVTVDDKLTSFKLIDKKRKFNFTWLKDDSLSDERIVSFTLVIIWNLKFLLCNQFLFFQLKYNVSNKEGFLVGGKLAECSEPDNSDTADRFKSLAYKVFSLVTRDSNSCPTQEVILKYLRF